MALTNNNMIPVTANLVAGQRLVRVKGSNIWFPVGLGGNVGQIITYIENSPKSLEMNNANENETWVITADSIKSGGYQEPNKAFQDVNPSLITGFWVSNTTTGNITWRNKNTKVLIQAYQVQTCRDNIGTTSWVLEGSDDGSNWTTIDTRAGVPVSLAYPITYNCHENITSYYYHRLRAVASTTNTIFDKIKTFYLNANGTDATTDDILLGKKAFTTNGLKVGTIPTITIVNDGVNITIPKGYNDTEREYFIGIDTTSANATANDILSGKTAYVNGQKLTGTVGNATVTQSGNSIAVTSGYVSESQNITVGTVYNQSSITPGTSNQIINADTYIANNVTVLGDSNLNSGNIKSGVTIFGVTGSLTEEGVDTSDATATSNDIIEGKTAYVNGLKINGAYTPSKEIRKALIIFGN